MKFKQFLSIFVSICLLSTQTMFAAGINPDHRDSNKVTVTSSIINIPIVNIVKPNSNGLSHNKFINYNVDKRGLILNNSNVAATTKLSGYVSPNENLQGENAKVILNEVTGTSKTLLNGFTEVAGPSADVIVANPNGISVNGGGFINTPKATLTTGNPLISSGLLQGFDTSKGDIWIEGDGFNTNNIDSVALFAKALHVNAKFYANNANITLGENQDTPSSNIALDSSLLGGIYAQTITLVSTDKGVGVNLPSEVFAQEDLNLNVNGDITLQTTVASSLHINSSEGSITTQNVTQANNDLSFNAKKDITVNNTLKANSIDITSADSSVTAHKAIQSTTNLNIDAKNDIELKSTALADSMQVTSSEGSIHTQDSIQANKDLTLNAKESINTDGTLYADNINLTSSQNSITTNKAIEAINSLNINAKGNIETKGTLLANSIQLESNKGNIHTQDSIQANKDLTLNAKKGINTDGTLYADNINLTSTERSIITKNAIQANDALTFNAKKDLAINDTLYSDNINLTSTEGSIITKNAIQANDVLAFNAKKDITVNDTLKANSIDIASIDSSVTTNKALQSTTDLKIKAQENIDLGGTLLAQDLLISTQGSITTKNAIQANDYLTLSAKNSIDIGGTLYANNINLQSYENTIITNEAIQAINNLNIYVKNSIDLEGTLLSKYLNIHILDGSLTTNKAIQANNLSFKVKDSINIGGTLYADNINLTSSQSSITTNKAIEAINSLNINAKDNIETKGTLLANNIDITSADSSVTAHKAIQSTTNLNIDAKNDIELKSTALADSMQVTSSEGSIHTQDSIQANKDLTLNAKESINTDGTLYADNINLTSSQSSITTNKAIEAINSLNINAKDNIETKGTLLANNIDITSADSSVTAHKAIQSTTNLNIDAKNDIELKSTALADSMQVTSNEGSIHTQDSIQANKNLTLNAKESINTDGTLYADNINLTSSQSSITTNKAIEAINSLNINAKDNIETKGTLLANNIDITSADSSVTAHKAIQSTTNLNIDAKNDIELKSTALADSMQVTSNEGSIHTQDSIQANKDLTLNAKESINTDGTLYADNINLTSSQNSITTNKAIEAINSLNINAKGNIETKGTLLANSIQLESNKGNIHTQDSIQANKDLTLNAKESINTDGTLYADNINLTSSQNSITTNKAIEAINSLNINAKDNIETKGTLLANNIDITSADSSVTAHKAIQSTTNLNIDAKNDIELKSTALADSMQVTSNEGSIHTQDSIQANKNLTLNAKESINTDGTLYANNINLTSSQSSITTNKAIEAINSLNINAKDSITTKGTLLANSIQLESNKGNIHTQDSIQANKNLTLNAKKGINTDGTLYADKINLTSSQNSITTNKAIEAINSLNINAKKDITVNNTLKANSIDITSADSSVTAHKAIQSTTNLNIDAKNDIELKSTALADSMQVTSSEGLISTQNSIQANKDLTFNAKKRIIVDETLYADNINLKSSQDSIFTNKAIEAIDTLTIDAKDSINLEGTLLSQYLNMNTENGSITIKHAIQTNNTLNLKAKKDIIINESLLADSLILKSQEGSITTKKAIQTNNILNFSALQDITIDGTLKANNISLLSVNGSILTNKAIESANNLNINAKNDIELKGTLLADSILVESLEGAITTKNAIQANDTLSFSAKKDITIDQSIVAKIMNIDSQNDLYNNADIYGQTINLKATNNIYNKNEISSIDTIDIQTTNLENRGLINAKNLTINANDIGNYNTLASSNDMKLYVVNSLYNHEGANILALNNLHVSQNSDNGKTKKITNEKAHIETIDGDITFYAKEFANTTDDLERSETTRTKHFDSSIIPYSWALNELDKEGKTITTKGIVKAKICTGHAEGGCSDWSDIYVVIKDDKKYFESQLYLDPHYSESFDYETIPYEYVKSAKKYKTGTASVCGNETCDTVDIYRYELLHVTKNDIIAKIDEYSSQFGIHYTQKPISIFSFFPTFEYSKKIPTSIREKIDITEVEEQAGTKPSPAILLSGNKLTLNVDTIKNYLSQIASNDTLTMNGFGLDNRGESLYRTTTLTGEYYYEYIHRIGNSKHKWAPLPSEETTELIDNLYSTIYSAKDIQGNLAVVNNIDIKSNQELIGSSATTIKTLPPTNSIDQLSDLDMQSNQDPLGNSDATIETFSQDDQVDQLSDLDMQSNQDPLGNIDATVETFSQDEQVDQLSDLTDGINIQSNQDTLKSSEKTLQKKSPIQENTANRVNQLADTTSDINKNPTFPLSDITLPEGQYGLFTIAKDKEADFLIETNPKFTIFENFISSDYMLNKLELDPTATQKRLGDNFYENRLVRESIFTQTGKRYLSDAITDDYTQYKYLMDNALAQRIALNLTPTVALTQAQINALTSDIVWMEETIVAGEKVLIPHVYIANVDNLKLNDRASAIVANENITLKVDSLINSGKIEAGKNLTVEADNTIQNLGGKLKSGADTVLRANETIYNVSGSIKADSLDITTSVFQSDIGVIKLENKLENGEEINELVSNRSNIEVQNSLNINTIDDLNILGTDIKAVKDINLISKQGNVKIVSRQTSNSFDNKTKTGYLKTSQTNQVGSNLEADNINISSNSLHVKASNIKANKDLHVDAVEDIIITSGETNEFFDMKHNVKGSLLGGSLKQQDTINNTKLITSTLKAKNITLNAKQIELIASKIEADTAKVKAEVLKLTSGKDSSREDHVKDSSSFLTKTMATKGHIKEDVVQAHIDVTKQFEFNDKDLTDKLEKLGIDKQELQDKIEEALQTDNIIKTLSSQQDLTQEQIELVKAYAENKEWDESHTGLTTIGTIVVAAFAVVCTGGLGIGETIAGADTLAATVVDAVAIDATNQIATAAITGESLKLDIKSMAQSAVTAGMLNYASGAIDNVLDLKGIDPSKMSLTQQFERAAANTVAKSGLNSIVYDTDFGDSLIMGLATDMSNLGFRAIGDIALDNGLKDGSSTKVLLHSLAGGISAELMGGEFAAGAASGAVNELISPYTNIDAKEAGISQKTANNIEVAVSQIAGGFAGGLVGGEDQVNIGSTIAQSATQFNQQLHEDERKFIEENTKKYAEEKGISPEEAQEILYLGAKYYNNKATTEVINKILQFNSDTNEQSKYTHQDIKDAYLFLRQESEGMIMQTVESADLENDRFQYYFTSTQSQYEDNSMNVPVIIGGMQDESMIFFPGSPIVKTASEAGTVISKATINIADDIYLKTGIRTDNFIQTQAIPRIKDEYYGLSNKFLANPTKYTQGGLDFSEGLLVPGIPPSNWWGISGYGAGKLYEYKDNIKDFINNIFIENIK